MTPAEIIAMALEVGGKEYGPNTRNWSFDLSQLERFAALVAAKEREECAQLVEIAKHDESDPLLGAPLIARAINECVEDIAAAIRAKGKS